MVNGFEIKKLMANIYNRLGISDYKFNKLSRKWNNQYIRVVNYHHVTDVHSFEKQLMYYNNYFQNINIDEFETFMITGKMKSLAKPGIMLTFDDGYMDNYSNGLSCLEKNGFTGWFMVSSDLMGKQGYMDKDSVIDLIEKGHVIGCHTASHHRMMEDDTEENLDYEIVESKRKLERELNIPIKIFCWCGGEEEHYTERAAKKLEKQGIHMDL